MLLVPKFNTSTIVCGNGQEVIHSSFDIVGAEFIIGYEARFAEDPLMTNPSLKNRETVERCTLVAVVL